MNRMEFLKNIIRQIDYRATSMKPKEIIELVTIFKQNNQLGRYGELEAIVEDGFLFINKLKVGRIASRSPKLVCTDAAAYYEGGCIGN